MKKLELDQMGLVEMNSTEMEEVDGGGFFGALIGFVVGAAIIAFGGEINGQPSDNWFAGGLVGAAAGAVLIPF